MHLFTCPYETGNFYRDREPVHGIVSGIASINLPVCDDSFISFHADLAGLSFLMRGAFPDSVCAGGLFAFWALPVLACLAMAVGPGAVIEPSKEELECLIEMCANSELATVTGAQMLKMAEKAKQSTKMADHVDVNSESAKERTVCVEFLEYVDALAWKWWPIDMACCRTNEQRCDQMKLFYSQRPSKMVLGFSTRMGPALLHGVANSKKQPDGLCKWFAPSAPMETGILAEVKKLSNFPQHLSLLQGEDMQHAGGDEEDTAMVSARSQKVPMVAAGFDEAARPKDSFDGKPTCGRSRARIAQARARRARTPDPYS